MQRVIIGPYEEGFDLKPYYKWLSDSLIGKGKPSDPDLKQIFSSADIVELGDHIVLTKDWVARQNPWDPGIVGLAATGNKHKVRETAYPLLDTVLDVWDKMSFTPGPDTEEEGENAIVISRDKVTEGAYKPFWDATRREKQAGLGIIGAADPTKVLLMGEDTASVKPKILSQASCWEGVRNRPLIREAFHPDEPFPGVRINEIQNAVGGALNLLHLFNQAAKEMRDKGHVFSDEHVDVSTYFLKFLEYDPRQPLPKEGIFIMAAEFGRIFLPVEDYHFVMEDKGKRQWELNDFDQPKGFRGKTDEKGAPITLATLRDMPETGFYKDTFTRARGMRGLVTALGIPQSKIPRSLEHVDRPDAAFISNLSFGEFAKDNQQVSKVGSYSSVREKIRIESFADFDKAFWNADGALIEDWKYDETKAANNKLYALEQDLITQMVALNRATYKPLGAKAAAGAPIFVDEQVFGRGLLAGLSNSWKYRTFTTQEEYILRRYTDKNSLAATMSAGQWDPRHYKKAPNPDDIQMHLMDKREMEEMLGFAQGASSYGACEAFIGSASSQIPSGNEDAKSYVYETGKRTITATHGGASRHIMGEFYKGMIRAAEDGHTNFINVGHRVPLASRVEGSLRPMLREFGLEPTVGDFDSKYMAFLREGDRDLINVYTHDYMAERKHGILAPADVVTAFIGGTGTEDEFLPVMYHNLMVEMRGYGIFPGFNNEQKRPIHFISSRVMNGGDKNRGFYDAMKVSFTPFEQELLCMNFFERWQDAREAADLHLESLGHDLFAPRHGYEMGRELYLVNG